MSKKEQIIFGIIEDFRSGKTSRKLTALKLSVSEKTVQRKAKKIREQGISGIKHGNYGKTAHNKVQEAIRQEFVKLYKDKYPDFNFAHALEMMKIHHDLDIGYQTFRKWCREEGLGKVRRRRASKARIARERVANEGLMWQMDGSPHKWNGKDDWCLIALIDDATSDLVNAKFTPSETTWACMNVTRSAIKEKGIPEFILTDEAGWSARSSGKRQQFSQFARACEELGIKIIATPTAESKGRVERLFRTCQDRLVPEFRVYGINTMLDANRYLEQVYLPEWCQKRTVEPSSSSTRYRQVPEGVDLKEIFCLIYKRIVNRDHTVHFDGERYKINPDRLGNLWKKQVKVHKYENEEINIFYGDTKLEFSKMLKPQRRWKREA